MSLTLSSGIDRKRPWAVWLIAIYFVYYGSFPLIAPFLAHMGVTLPLTAGFMVQHMTRLDYIPFIIAGALCLYGVRELLHLHRIALYLLPIGGAFRGLLTLWTLVTKWGVERLTPEMRHNVVIGGLVGLGTFFLLYLYLLRLSRKGILS